MDEARDEQRSWHRENKALGKQRVHGERGSPHGFGTVSELHCDALHAHAAR